MEVEWQANTWRQEFRFIRGKLIVGLLKKSTWPRGAYGEFHGTMLRFKQKNWWKSTTSILDIEGKNEIGIIEIKNIKRTAKITINDQVYQFKFQNRGFNNWQVSDEFSSAIFTINNSKNQGKIEINDINPAAILAAMYTREKFISYLG